MEKITAFTQEKSEAIFETENSLHVASNCSVDKPELLNQLKKCLVENEAEMNEEDYNYLQDLLNRII